METELVLSTPVWEAIEGAAADTADAHHWVAVYTDLVRALDRVLIAMAAEQAAPEEARRVRQRRLELLRRLRYWQRLDGQTPPLP